MREKLIELLKDADELPFDTYDGAVDFLIANGVTIATDNSDGDKMDFCGELCNFAEGLIKKAREPKWIPVTERLPHPNEVVLTWSEQLADLTAGSLLCEFEADEVTHWMPLPEPPKGE